MSIKYLYYTESMAIGGTLSAAHAVPLLDQMLGMFGGKRMCVHPNDADYKATSAEQYPTLAAAQAAHPSHTWIYLDPDATQYIDEIEHPANDVVYAVGHDATGYGGEELNGNTCKLRTIRAKPFVGFALVCLSVVAHDRWTRMKSWH